MKILLVEPDAVLASICVNYLEKNKIKVRVVSNAQSAIDAVDDEIPDLILLELQLSAHNGFEFLYELRSYPEWQSIPIIIHSLIPQYVTELSKNKMEQLGIKEYLYKPTTSLKSLNNCIDRYVFTIDE